MALTALQKEKLYVVVLEATNAQTREQAIRTLFDAFFVSTVQQKALLQTMIDTIKARRQAALTVLPQTTTDLTADVTALDALTANL